MSPAKRSLTRHQFVDAAFALVDADGAEAFTMRKLGTALGVDPMAVYHHLPNKAAVFDALVDEVWARVDPPASPPGTPWPEQVMALADQLRSTLLAHPRLVPVIATRPIATPRLLALTDAHLGRLAEAGLPEASAMALLDCVIAFVVGKVQGEVRNPGSDGDTTPDAVVAGISPDALPHVATALATGYDWDPEGQFRRGLSALVAGWTPQP